jgi:integrase
MRNGSSSCFSRLTLNKRNHFVDTAKITGPFTKGFWGITRGTPDKMINGQKTRKPGQRQRSGGRGKGVWQGADESDRQHFTGREVEGLIEATKGSRNEALDRCLLLLMFRQGLRVSEACRMKLDQVDGESRVLHVARLKAGLSTTQPLRGDELRAIAGWLKERARMKPTGSTFFVSEQEPVAPFNRQLGPPKKRHRCVPAPACPSAHAASRLRLCSCRSRRGHPAHSGLFGPPEYSAHGQVYCHQPGRVRKAVAIKADMIASIIL